MDHNRTVAEWILTGPGAEQIVRLWENENNEGRLGELRLAASNYLSTPGLRLLLALVIAVVGVIFALIAAASSEFRTALALWLITLLTAVILRLWRRKPSRLLDRFTHDFVILANSLADQNCVYSWTADRLKEKIAAKLPTISGNRHEQAFLFGLACKFGLFRNQSLSEFFAQAKSPPINGQNQN